MRWLVRPDEALERARPPVRAFLAFTALLLAAAIAQRAVQGALTPSGLEQLLADAQPPGSTFGSMLLWEELHTGSFLYGFLLLTLGSLLVVCPVSSRVRSGLLGTALVSALADLLLPFLAFRLPGWAVLRVAGFAVACASLLALIALVWRCFGKRASRDA